MERKNAEAIGAVERRDYEQELANRRKRVSDLEADISKLMATFLKKKDPIIERLANKEIEKLREDIEREEGICKELEGMMRVGREKNALLGEIQLTINDSVYLIESADFEQKCKIMDVLSVRVSLGFKNPHETFV